MMMEMIVFAIALVAAQTIAGITMMTVFMSKWFIKKYYKKIMKLATEIVEEIDMESEEEA